jgi:hypothetical protein
LQDAGIFVVVELLHKTTGRSSSGYIGKNTELRCNRVGATIANGRIEREILTAIGN